MVKRRLFGPVQWLARKKTLSAACIPTLIGIGIGMTYGSDFALARTAFLIATAWGIACWLESDTLAKKKPRRTGSQNERKVAAYRHKLRAYRSWKFGGCGVILALLMVATLFVNEKSRSQELAKLTGSLVPGDDPAPPINMDCPVPPGDFAIYLGDTVASAREFPLVLAKVHGQDKLKIERDERGGLALTGEIRASDGRMIAEVSKNSFTISPTHYFKKDRPDRSTLRIYDEYGTLVLSVQYLNKTAIKILGVFRYPGASPTVVEEHSLSLAGSEPIERGCFGDFRTLLEVH